MGEGELFIDDDHLLEDLQNINSSAHHGEEEGGDELLSAHHILTVKCVGIFIMMALTTLFCLLPYKTYSCEHRQRLISFANCFGGGVLFGTIFLHLIPEVSVQMNEYQLMTERTFPIPLAETLEVLGFCLILFLETLFDELSVRKLRKGMYAEDCEKCEENHNNLHVLQNVNPTECEASQPADTTDIIAADKNGLLVNSKVPKTCVVEKRHNIAILLASLVTHSVFEGGAVGVERETQTLLGLLGAILIHKCAIALTLGSRLVTQKIRFQKGCIYAMMLSLGTPVGIVLGVTVQAKLNGSVLDLVSATIQALGIGIFLYITFAWN
eukprot:sb/3466755/